MANSTFEPLVKAKETLKVFASSAPSPRELLANRDQEFQRLHIILPSTAKIEEPQRLIIQAWDQCERIIRDFDGSVTVEATDSRAEHPDRISIDSEDGGVLSQNGIRFNSPGVHYLILREETTGERFVSNPIRVDTEIDRQLFWGDIHLHSILSDGTGLPREGYRFGRDVMGLDVVAYTDHDTMGFFIPPKWQGERMHRAYFDRLCAIADEFNDEGSFVTLPAYEWTKQPNVGGHLNVYFEDSEDAKLFDSRAASSHTYEQLWARLQDWNQEHESRVVTVPHHPAEAMYPFDFSAVDYDDELAPIVEIYSQWGSSERPASEGNEFPLAMGQGEADEDGYYVQDAHRLGYKVGVMGGSDYHGPHPGHSLIHTRPHLPSFQDWRKRGLGWSNIWRIWNEKSYPGGLTAFLATELTREAVMSALRSRSVYATTQPHRILVDFRVNGVDVAEQSEAVIVDSLESAREISVEVHGSAPIADVSLIKNNSVWQSIERADDPDASIEAFGISEKWTDETPISGMSWDSERRATGDVYVLRVRQASDGSHPGMAWVGPIWVELDL